MATSQGVIDDLLPRLSAAGRVTARKMFGEFCLYLDGKPVALVCDNVLFVKPTTPGRELVPDAPAAPPYPGAKPHLRIDEEQWADREALCRLLTVTFDALPAVKPKKAKE